MLLFACVLLIGIICLFIYYFSEEKFSSGLVNDKKIVNSLTNKKFYYQNRPEKYDEKVPIFANLDFTDFFSLKHGTVVCCKTKQAYSLIKKHCPHLKVVYTGFTSLDRFSSKYTQNYRKFLHVFGQSPHKGTPKIVKIWKKHPEWPELLMIGSNRWNAIDNIGDYSAKNIKLIKECLSEKELEKTMNTNGIHLCMSEIEGFGHYLNEARSAKAVVVYTDAEPMNEFFDKTTGFGVSAVFIGVKPPFCPVYGFSEKDFVKTINTILSTEISVLQKMGELSRKKFLINDNDFARTITKFSSINE